jgi:hypothetical protein
MKFHLCGIPLVASDADRSEILEILALVNNKILSIVCELLDSSRWHKRAEDNLSAHAK